MRLTRVPPLERAAGWKILVQLTTLRIALEVFLEYVASELVSHRRSADASSYGAGPDGTKAGSGERCRRGGVYEQAVSASRARP